VTALRRVAPTTLESTRGMVTAGSAGAAAVGAQILAQGGNAMDAAVATAFASGVVEPAMSGIGGRGYLVAFRRGYDEALVIDGHERAPRAARPDMFEVEAGRRRIVSGWGVETEVAGAANRDGHLAIAVPGVVPALALAHARSGELSWRAVVEPSIALARSGFEVDETLATLIAAHAERLARFPATAAIFLPDGRAPAVGERLVQRDLASSLELIAERGAMALRDGPLACAIVDEMARGGGVLSLDDLRLIEPRVWERAATATFRGHRLLGVPDATGAVTLFEILNMIEAAGLEGEALGAANAHLLAEMFRAAFEDRRRWIDDGDHAEVPFRGLIDKEFARTRVAQIDRARRSAELAASDPFAFDASPARGNRPAAGSPVADRHTTHFCVVDDQRMVVSMTQSLIDPFGSAVVARGTGVLLNSAMHNFNPVPGELGSIAPWKRAAHFGTPLVVLDPAGNARLAAGAGGGTKIVTGLAQVLLRVIERGEPLPDAIAAPRIHCDGAAVEVDQRVAAQLAPELRARGHQVEPRGSSFGAPAFARINAIEITPDGLTGAADPFSNAGAAAPQQQA
jgi:gamma-glutamyltranspeptidase / glutathione hydrolase